jgi:hypothetical protein
MTSESGRALRACVAALAEGDFQSRCVGVGQVACATADDRSSARVLPVRGVAIEPQAPSRASGVGQRLTAAPRLMPCEPSICDGVGWSWRFSFGEARGVGHCSGTRRTAVAAPRPCASDGADEDARSLMRSANPGRLKDVPLRIVPEAVQVTEDLAERRAAFGAEQAAHVLQDRVARS